VCSITIICHEEGPIIGYLIFIGVLLIGMLTAVAFYKRLIPYSLYKKMSNSDYFPTEVSSGYGSINPGNNTEKSHDSK